MVSTALDKWLPARADRPTLGLLLLAWGLLYVPTFYGLMNGLWAKEEHSYGPVILASSLWLIWQSREELARRRLRPRPVLGWLLIAISLLGYALGRSQDILMFEVGSLLTMLAGAALLFIGPKALRILITPLAVMFFVIPLPGDIVAAVTAPLKAAVSAVAGEVLYAAGYSISRTGVILTVGPYQLLVADACAGLTSMFTLEAMGLVYIKLMGYTSKLRNTLLLVSLIPIAFCANVIRVIMLCLITFHLGDEVGQGLMHSAAGLILFLVAMVLMLSMDKLLGLLPQKRKSTRKKISHSTPRVQKPPRVATIDDFPPTEIMKRA